MGVGLEGKSAEAAQDPGVRDPTGMGLLEFP